MSDKKIVCFGEVLWDVYPDGKRLGGAPFNVAAHLFIQGTTASIITRIGTDELGDEIHQEIKNQKITDDLVQLDESLLTGTVQVTLDNKGIPSYEISEPSAWDRIEPTTNNIEAVKRSNGLVFGSLALRSETNLKTLKELAHHAPLNICDLNIRQKYYSKELIVMVLEMADILKINDDEAELLTEFFGYQEDLYEYLTREYNLEVIIQTKGKDGAEAYHKGITYNAEGEEVTVIDTVGAGDAFLASFIHNYINGKDINVCLSAGCHAGGYVASRRGAIPTLDSE